jgi:transcription initiation factor TFIID TATA-box-binding protein
MLPCLVALITGNPTSWGNAYCMHLKLRHDRHRKRIGHYIKFISNETGAVDGKRRSYERRQFMSNFKAAEPTIKIENVVASATLNQKVDLNAIVKGFPGVEYRPEQFPGLVFRLKKPKTATLIFNSGKMVCTGAKSEKEAKRAVLKVIRELKRSGIVIVSKPELKIQNIVASGNLYGKIDLEKCAYTLEKTMYEPEQFPGLIYRMAEPKVVILLFASGKLVCTGAKQEGDVYKSVEKLHAKLEDEELIYYEE